MKYAKESAKVVHGIPNGHEILKRMCTSSEGDAVRRMLPEKRLKHLLPRVVMQPSEVLNTTFSF